MDALKRYEKRVENLIKKRDTAIREIARIMCYETDTVLNSCNCGGSIEMHYDMGGPFYILTIYPKSENHRRELAINFFKRIAKRLDVMLAVNDCKPLEQLSKEVDDGLIAARARLRARQPIIYRRGA